MRPTAILRRLILPTLFTVLVTAAGAEDPGPGTDSPGREHRVLAALAGDFELVSTYWHGASAQPEISRLPARRELILEGRVLRLDVGPDDEGFRGAGLMGYDRVAQTYWYTWTDTTTTGLAMLTGELDPRGAGVLAGRLPTPYGTLRLRVERRFEDEVEIHDYFVPAPGGEGETRMLELRYRRLPEGRPASSASGAPAGGR